MPGTEMALRGSAVATAVRMVGVAMAVPRPPGAYSYVAADRPKAELTGAALLLLRSRRERRAALLSLTVAALAAAAGTKVNRLLRCPYRDLRATGPGPTDTAVAVALAAAAAAALPGGGPATEVLVCLVGYAGSRPGEPAGVAAAAALGLAGGTVVSAVTGHRQRGAAPLG
ncbi:hypothetical protein [Streptacidiphilus sp. P02-A3a]|uniref:hypothetical protein n=1 Tax=Streptacidiphilus sp. P02-A3a TaxID=2704468 RepID=UPI0015FD22FB|nr:hypothetical protein [Streptacidiphilus sp. P02-A3a]QMU69135.1 hypothetical protein GXP74_13645 [Streptacidiphilus sp. P02-A3a]